MSERFDAVVVGAGLVGAGHGPRTGSSAARRSACWRPARWPPGRPAHPSPGSTPPARPNRATIGSTPKAWRATGAGPSAGARRRPAAMRRAASAGRSRRRPSPWTSFAFPSMRSNPSAIPAAGWTAARCARWSRASPSARRRGLPGPADAWLGRPALGPASGGRDRPRRRRGARGGPGRRFRRAGRAVCGVATADGGALAAGATVLAAGPWTAALAAGALGAATQDIPVDRVPGLLVELPPESAGALRSPRIVYAPDEGAWHMRPTPAGGALMGADDIDDLCGENPGPEALAECVRMALERGAALSARLRRRPRRRDRARAHRRAPDAARRPLHRRARSGD